MHMCVLVHEFRDSSVLLKVLELISQQKGQPAKNIFPFCSVSAAGVKLTPGCRSGSLPITFQEHPSPLICLVHTSSFLSRNVSLWNLPDPPRQRDHLFFLVLAVLWTVFYFYTCCFVYKYYLLWPLSLCYSVNSWRKESHSSLFPLCLEQ